MRVETINNLCKVLLHQENWLIHNGNEVYSAAKSEFEFTYTVL